MEEVVLSMLWWRWGNGGGTEVGINISSSRSLILGGGFSLWGRSRKTSSSNECGRIAPVTLTAMTGLALVAVLFISSSR